MSMTAPTKWPVARLFPYGKSGLKLVTMTLTDWMALSLPVWEEWIEIRRVFGAERPARRLFPYGKSGLKSNTNGEIDDIIARLFPYGKSGLK